MNTLDVPLDPANANRYAYVGDPINNVDPTGRDTWDTRSAVPESSPGATL